MVRLRLSQVLFAVVLAVLVAVSCLLLSTHFSGGSHHKVASLGPRRYSQDGARLQLNAVSVPQSRAASLLTRGEFQQKQMRRYCQKVGLSNGLYQLPPPNSTELQLLYRHLIFDDQRETMFCFVEKNGCTNMKRLHFVSQGVLPLRSIRDSHVELKYMERGLKLTSLLNKTLTEVGRLHRIKKYYKYMIVRNPLERLVSGYRNKIEPPLFGLSMKFPNYVKRSILDRYRPFDYAQWIAKDGQYNMSISFPEFVTYFVDLPYEALNPHFKPMMYTCHPCHVWFDFYGNFNTLDVDTSLIIERLHVLPEYYPKFSNHAPGDETRLYLTHYFDQLSQGQRIALFEKLKQELEFYYYLYPEEKNSHMQLLGVQEEIVVPDVD